MTNEERAALDERIRDMKRRGIPTSERIAILARERAAAGPNPEEGKPPSPLTPVVPNDDSADEATSNPSIDVNRDEKPDGVPAAENERDAAATQSTNLNLEVRSMSDLSMKAHPQPAATADLALLTVGDVARLLKLSQRQVWKLAKAKRLPAPLKLGRSVRWRATDLARFLEAGADPAKYNGGLA